MRTKTKLPRILKIHRIDGFKITCVFNTGEYKTIDFEKLFREWEVKEDRVEYALLDEREFRKVIVNESNTLAWPNIPVSFASFDKPGTVETAPFDLSPDVLYAAGEPYAKNQKTVGDIVREVRERLQLTQQQLAEKSGTTKPYISRLENNKSGIELSTLEKIVESGLGGEMQLKVIIPGENNEDLTFEASFGHPAHPKNPEKRTRERGRGNKLGVERLGRR